MTNNRDRNLNSRRVWTLLGSVVSGASLFVFCWMLAFTFGIAAGPASVVACAATAGAWRAVGFNEPRLKAVEARSAERRH